ncbi:MAG: Pr6Pr family membrane protein [Hyphomonadaceae bacterium]|nr:Pr6Pr family membrane protein [Hyphomonadaceae bacterium]
MKLAARAVAAFGALLGLAGLGLQYWLLYADMSANGASALDVLWRFYVYFTLLTNTLVTLVFARAVLKPDSLEGLNAPRVELMAVTSIMFVCIVYNILLAPRWDPQGWQKLADVIVHNAVPALFLVFWALRPHGGLKWAHAVFAGLWPLAYAMYGLSRGALDGFYPYFFMDPTSASYAEIAINVLGLFLAFLTGALLLIGISRALARRKS